jgi:TolB-like protein/DNA-binding winged helix-turn-helix (wHTH) protein/Tfp pilus assembly protein PilF
VRAKFGRFELDVETGELRKDGVRVHVQEKPFQVLKVLVLRAGDLVTRDELRQQLWPPDTFVDFDNSLNTAVTKLREALGDTAGDHRFIETLARRGYRFVAPVTIAADAMTATAEPADVPSPSVPARRRVPRSGVIGAVAALVVVIAAGLAWRRDAGSPPPRLVVLPFENLSGDTTQEYLSDGFTEEMIARLGSQYADSLGVIARTSAMSYKGTRKRVDEIGRDLDVQFVMEGSLQRVDDRLRVTAQLIRVSDQTHVWANTYERRITDILDIQQEIAAAISDATHASLAANGPGATAAATAAPRHNDPVAYELYLQGRHLWNQRTGPEVRSSLTFFQRALERQPRYALAHVGIANAYLILGASSEMAYGDAYALARAAVLKALEIDDSLGEAHTSLASLITDYDWDWPQADAHFRRALALNPNDVTTHHWYSEFLMRVGRRDEAIREAEAARRVDPLSPNANINLGHQLILARRFDAGIARHTQSLELFPQFSLLHSALGFAYAHAGRPALAVQHFERFRTIVGDTPDTVALTGYAYGRAGDVRGARRALETLDGMTASRSVPAIDRAVVHIGLGESDAAIQWLSRAVDERNWQVGFLAVDPLYDPVRTDARFRSLVTRVGLPM